MHVCLLYVGSNNRGCSGIDNNSRDAIGGNKCFISPRKVDALCKQQITNIVSGSSQQVLAITKPGKVYSWGYNSNGELGHGSTTPSPNPNPTKIAKLDQFQVKQVTCGYNHSMALTRDGKVSLHYTYYYCYLTCMHPFIACITMFSLLSTWLSMSDVNA